MKLNTENCAAQAPGRRVKIVEKNSGGTTTSTKQFIWDGLSMAEERNASNTVIKRFFAQGEQVPGASSPDDKLFYTWDHLGSVHELVDDNEVVSGRWDYDPYGQRSANLITSGALEANFAYTGHYAHAASGLTLAPFRAYDANLGRWLSRDPIAENGGNNLYGYVGGDPINAWDPLGLREIEYLDKETGKIRKFEDSKVFLDPKEIAEVYFFEWAALAAGEGVGAVLSRLWHALRVYRATNAICEWIGPGGKAMITKEGSDLIIQSKDKTKQIRFDLTNPHGDPGGPHINVETFKPRNKYPGDRSMDYSGNEHIYPR